MMWSLSCLVNPHIQLSSKCLNHNIETFDVDPFIDKRCKFPVEEIQATVDGAIFLEKHNA